MLLLARNWFARPSKKEVEEYSQRFEERLHHPDFTAVEKYFGCPLPACVQALYADHQELSRDIYGGKERHQGNIWKVLVVFKMNA